MRISDWSSDVCSSDLLCGYVPPRCGIVPADRDRAVDRKAVQRQIRELVLAIMAERDIDHARQLNMPFLRSEEHTSELQSLMRISYAVFCLKKKKHTNNKE